MWVKHNLEQTSEISIRYVPPAIHLLFTWKRCRFSIFLLLLQPLRCMALRWMCDSPRTGCARRITPIYSWREQAILQWSRRVISIVGCCHSVKLCAHAARTFRSQHCVCTQLPISWALYSLSFQVKVWKVYLFACTTLTNWRNKTIGKWVAWMFYVMKIGGLSHKEEALFKSLCCTKN